MAEAWNIIDDFLIPLDYNLKMPGWAAGKTINILWPEGGLACVWLDVHIGTAVGDRVRQLLQDVVNLKPDANERARRYCHRLLLVLREKAGEKIPKETIPPGKLSPHYTPAELADVFDRSWDTVKKLLRTIPHIKHSTKDYQVHVDYLPEKRR